MDSTGNKIIDYYDRLAPDYDRDRFGNTYGNFIDAEERYALDRLLGQPRGHVLEMACGTGRLLDYADCGIDASEKMLAEARRKFPHKDLRQALAQDTPFGDATFDAVYAFHLMMHLAPETIGDILREAYRLLKPGGRFIFDIPSRRRRKVRSGRQEGGWHGNTALDAADVESLSQGRFAISSVGGILFLPIHRFPVAWRSSLLRADRRLARGWLKNYSSYLIFELRKP